MIWEGQNHDKQQDTIKKILNKLHQASKKHQKIILCGDINIDMNKVEDKRYA